MKEGNFWGRIELLELIQQHGSITKAAGAMGMSYRKAWLLVDEMNEIAQKLVVTTLKGGNIFSSNIKIKSS